MALNIGDQAPDFSLPSTSGSNFTLSKELGGQPCVLYFYPKDFTKVCTKEACSFRDNFSIFKSLDIPVLGISTDSIPTHLKFKKEHALPFDLLSDAGGKVAKVYKALIPVVKMPKRITYLLDKEHKISAVYQDMFDGERHIKEMIAKIKNE